ncbi:MAG: murein transglycosylase A [Methyloligellaceae bacterium]
MTANGPRFVPRAFAELPQWAADRHGKAFAAFRLSCARIDWVARERASEAGGTAKGEPHPFLAVCLRALAHGEGIADAQAKAFFESHFVPHEVVQPDGDGFLTGYFEPELRASRTPSDTFYVPVYGKPDDLTVLVPDEKRGTLSDQMTAGRKTSDGVKPYPTRKAIEQGALRGRGLEIVFLDDPVAAFIMHVQGSGRAVLADGTVLRLSYAAKNGHPYTSIGRLLIERGEIGKDEMSLDTLTGWLRAHPKQARELMWENRSYIFFKEVVGQDSTAGPLGAQNVALTAGRSLAVDPGFHELGTPIWVSAPDLDAHGAASFHRLMVAQDVGSAIKGPERGDIFWGSGEAAGSIAGRTRHTGRFYVLLPRSDLPDS